MGLHLPFQQVQLAVQQGRGQGAIERASAEMIPAGKAHLGDEGAKGRQLRSSNLS